MNDAGESTAGGGRARLQFSEDRAAELAGVTALAGLVVPDAAAVRRIEDVSFRGGGFWIHFALSGTACEGAIALPGLVDTAVPARVFAELLRMSGALSGLDPALHLISGFSAAGPLTARIYEVYRGGQGGGLCRCANVSYAGSSELLTHLAAQARPASAALLALIRLRIGVDAALRSLPAACTLSCGSVTWRGRLNAPAPEDPAHFGITLESSEMNADGTIPLDIELGVLEITLEQFFRLLPGEVIEFDLPEPLEVFVKVGGRRWSAAILERAAGSTARLRLTELLDGPAGNNPRDSTNSRVSGDAGECRLARE